MCGSRTPHVCSVPGHFVMHRDEIPRAIPHNLSLQVMSGVARAMQRPTPCRLTLRHRETYGRIIARVRASLPSEPWQTCHGCAEANNLSFSCTAAKPTRTTCSSKEQIQ